MNWLKSAAGEFINELTSDIKEIGHSGGSLPDGTSNGAADEHANGTSNSQAPRFTNGAEAKSAPSVSRAAMEKPPAQPPAVVARPLAADEELFDWDDSGDEAQEPPLAAKSSPPDVVVPDAVADVAAVPSAATTSTATVQPDSAAADGWAQDDLAWPEEAEIATEPWDCGTPESVSALGSAEPREAVTSEAETDEVFARINGAAGAHDIAACQVPVETEVEEAKQSLQASQPSTHQMSSNKKADDAGTDGAYEQMASLHEAKKNAAALEQRVQDLERELSESQARLTAANQQLQTRTAEACDLRSNLSMETQRSTEAVKEAERLSCLVRELEGRCQEQVQVAELSAANSQAEVISLLQEAKDRERGLEAELRELRESQSAAVPELPIAELERRLEESTAQLASFMERLEEEAKCRSAAVAEANDLRNVAQERERLLEERAAELAVLRAELAGRELPTAPTQECRGGLAAASTTAELLENFAQALAAAQGKVLRDRLQALRGNHARDTSPAQAVAQASLTQAAQAAAQVPAVSVATEPAPQVTEALHEEDVGWGSDDDGAP